MYVLGNKELSGINSVKISNSEFSFNKASLDGGAIYADTNSNIQLIDVNFVNNTAVRNGGAIFINGGAEVSIFAISRDVVFSDNKAGGVYNGVYSM